MLDADDLLRGVLMGALGGRRKRSGRALRYLTRRGGGSLVNASTLLTAAGVAWGVIETLQNQNAPPQAAPVPGSGSGGASAPAAPPPPLPAAAGGDEVPPDALRMIRLAISAASADGALGDDERARILEQARDAGAQAIVERELAAPRPLAAIVAGVTDPVQAATLYVLAFSIIRGDETVTGAERIYLAQLAHHLGLDPATTARLEADAAARIDEA